MATTKKRGHTAGTWTVVDTVTDGCRIDTPTGTVAESIYWRPDADLMAAAPAMLEALEHIAELARDVRYDLIAKYVESEHASFRAAIRAARGEA